MNLAYLKAKQLFDDNSDEDTDASNSDNTDNTSDEYSLGDETPSVDEPETATPEEPDVKEPTASPEISRNSASSDRFKAIFDAANSSPTGPANTAYQQKLSQGPPEVVPGKINRLAAILGGISDGGLKGAGVGAKTANDILERPQEHALNDYGNRIKTLQAGAALEDKEMGRKASIAKTAIGDVHNQEMEKVAQQKLIDQQKHWTEQDKARAASELDKGWRFSTNQNDGSIVLTKMINGELKVVQGPKVGESLSEKTKRELDKFNQEEAVKQKGRKEIVNQEEAGRNSRSQASIDAANARADQTDSRVRDGKDKPKTNSPAQEQTERLNKMRAAAADPDNADKQDFFIRSGKNHDGPVIGIKMPGNGWNPLNRRNVHDDKETYDALFETVYGKKPKDDK